MKILVSAGEASGDLYASRLAEALRRRFPEADFFGCAGPKMQAAGVRPVVDAHQLAVVGLVEVVTHIPRIYGEYRRLIAAAEAERPQLAILTDSPDFHLRVAKRLKKLGIPVLYLVAPQAWAWRSHRTRAMARDLAHLFCIFPFEERFFRERGVPATYVGHPLAGRIAPSVSREEFRQSIGIRQDQRLVALLPGSREGEATRHLPILDDTIRIMSRREDLVFVWGAAPKLRSLFHNRISPPSIQVCEGRSWDLLAACDVALAASGTVTMEAALLGAPMVTFYRVTPVSWLLGKLLVRTPFYSMVNLIAERMIVPELMQNEATGEALAAEAMRLLEDAIVRERQQNGLAEVAARLRTAHDPMEWAAELAANYLR